MEKYSKSDLIKKAKEKSLYKYRGKVLEIIRVSENIVNCVMYKVSKGETILTCFTCFAAIGQDFRMNYVKNSRIKIKFKIKSCKYNKKYYTNLIVVEHELWRINDDKLSKVERIEKIEQSAAEKAKAKQTGIKFDSNEWGV